MWRKVSKNKYNAKKTIVDGIKFDSKKESDYYVQLKLEESAGLIDYFLRQVPFDLPGNIKYRVDFMVVYQSSIKYVDVKGYMTSISKMKIKQVESIYNVEIVIL
jgi:Protein of unknown function (DUF1064)